MRELYALDNSVLLFRALRDVWDADVEAQPALALLCVVARDAILRVGGCNPGHVLKLGGSLDPVYNAVGIAELAVEKGAATLLVPVSARKQLNELSDDMVTKISILYYADARDALLKALSD